MRYSIELLRTKNKKTKKQRYYKKVCDAFTRISFKEYDNIYSAAYGFNNLFTNSNKKVTRFFTGCTFYSKDNK